MARRGLVLFLVLVAGLDAACTAAVVATGNPLWIFALMWSVALASVVCRLVGGEGIRDVSFRFGGLRTLVFLVVGWLAPVVVGFIAYGTAWSTGLAVFTAPPGGFVAGLVYAGTTATVFTLVGAAGEEIGWRGYMLTRLIDAGAPRPALVSGLIWALWHVPLILGGVYVADPAQPVLLTVVLFIVSVTAFGYLFAYVRLQTGSIWPPIVLHASWNAVIQGGFDPASTGAAAKLWTGEAGILVAAVLILLAVAVSLGKWRMLRYPGAPIPVTA